jgi:hypothetical protein
LFGAIKGIDRRRCGADNAKYKKSQYNEEFLMAMLSVLYPSQWLKSIDLDGGELTVNIRGLSREKVGKEQEQKIIIEWLEDGVKPMILNKSNATTIGKLYGQDTSQWRGRPVTLYETTTEAFGETHDVIRVKDRVPEQTPVTA